MNELRVKRQNNKWTGLLTKALTDDTDKQNKQNLIANRSQRPKGRGTHRVGGRVDRLLVLSEYVAFCVVIYKQRICAFPDR